MASMARRRPRPIRSERHWSLSVDARQAQGPLRTVAGGRQPPLGVEQEEMAVDLLEVCCSFRRALWTRERFNSPGRRRSRSAS